MRRGTHNFAGDVCLFYQNVTVIPSIHQLSALATSAQSLSTAGDYMDSRIIDFPGGYQQLRQQVERWIGTVFERTAAQNFSVSHSSMASSSGSSTTLSVSFGESLAFSINDSTDTDSATTTVTATLCNYTFERDFEQCIEFLTGGEQQTQSDTRATIPAWENEAWYTALTIEDRQRYDWLRPYRERWESGEMASEELAQKFGKDVDTVRGWRRDLNRRHCPGMDWKRYKKGCE